MREASDLIVVGTITKVQDLDETNSVLWPGSKFRGVEATFAVSKVLKGDAATRTVVLHYYRFETEWGRPANGPCFLNLTPTDTNQFLLHLVRDGASRFAPVSGQVDPLLDAVRVFPPQFSAPKLRIEDALAIARDYVQQHHVEVADSYIDSTRLDLNPGGDRGKFWLVTWQRNEYANGHFIKGGQFIMCIYMDRTVEVFYRD